MTPKSPKNIRVFSSKTCVPCLQLKRWLESQSVEYDLVDREQDPQAFNEIVAITGVTTVPQVLIDDQPIVGLNIGRTKQLLGL